MSVRKCFSLIFTLCAALFAVRPAIAQPEARFQLVQTGVDNLKEDLKYLVDLSPNPALKGQWKTVNELLDSFAEGLDYKKPIRMDVVVGKELAYEIHLPVGNLDKLKGNLKGLGYTVKPVQGSLKDTLFTLTPGGKAAAKKPMYMRILNGYASIAATQAAIPANMPDPIRSVQPLLDKKFDVVLALKNSGAAADVAGRKANLQEQRRQLEAGTVLKRNEDKNEFALRKLALVQNLTEAERFIVETDELLFGWTTTIAANGAPGKGRLDFSLSALPGTDLFQSAQILAEKSSYFANVQLGANPVLAGKINFAIDPLRRNHFKDFYNTVRPVLVAQVDTLAILETDEQRAGTKKACGLLLDMLTDGLNLNVLDIFLDLHSAGDGKHTLICGVRADDGKKADQIVELLPQLNAGREIKLNIQQIADASLHSVAVPEHRQAAFQKLFPGETTIYVATSKDAVWGAAGVDAVAELEKAINQAAQPAPAAVDPRIVYFSGQAMGLIDLIDITRPETGRKDEKSLSKEELARLKQREKDLEKIRNLAIAAMKGCDPTFSGELKKNGATIEGSMDFSECVLGFIGAAIADFSKNFQ